ncbi:endo-1,4-beta-xylanase [Natronospora cellulosivora (SeqCode)]
MFTSFALAEDTDSVPSLYEAYEEYFPIGTAVAVAQWNRTLDSHGDLIMKHFNSVTAENSMKPDSLQPSEGVFNFNTANELVDFAEANGKKVRGHTLVWHNQTPNWFFEDENGDQVDRDTLIARMENHINRVMGEYKGRVYAWDVVNEAIDGGTYRDTPWLNIIGEEYIAMAFEFAHKADPDAKLFYNDYNTIQRRDEIYEMLEGLILDGVPVHGIGMQGHWDIQGPSIREIERTIQMFAELDELTEYDFEIQITELDVSMFPWGDNRRLSAPARRMLNAQADRYEELFELFIEYSDIITGVSLWGVADDATWLDYFPVSDRNDWPLLFDEDHEPKESFWRVIELTK